MKLHNKNHEVSFRLKGRPEQSHGGFLEMILNFSTQLCVQGYHGGSLKLALMGVVTPQKSANAINQGFCPPQRAGY